MVAGVHSTILADRAVSSAQSNSSVTETADQNVENQTKYQLIKSNESPRVDQISRTGAVYIFKVSILNAVIFLVRSINSLRSFFRDCMSDDSENSRTDSDCLSSIHTSYNSSYGYSTNHSACESHAGDPNNCFWHDEIT